MWDKYTNSLNYTGKNILAIDYGKKFTGVATYKVGIDPYPLSYGRIAYKNDKQLLADLLTICTNEGVEVVIVGVPKMLDGQSTTMSKTIIAFAQLFKSSWVDEFFFIQDETLSTFEAKERMKNSAEFNFKIDLKRVDDVAACIILEDFLKKDL